MDMESNRPPSRRSERRFALTLLFVSIATFLLLQCSFSAASSVDQHGSLRAELFHRDHPFSRNRSTRHLSHSEKPQHDGSADDRANSFVGRRLQPATSTLNGSITWETNITDGAGYEYLMVISLGTPPQEFVAVADTGSWLTWLQCTPCTSCFTQPTPLFDPTASSTYQSLSCASAGCSALMQSNPITNCSATCPYTQTYFDGSSTAGNFSSETIHLRNSNGEIIAVPDFWFGCSYTSSSPSALFDSTDGIVGLGPEITSLPSQLGQVFEDKFSYCLVNRSSASVQSSLLLFGKDASLGLQLQYTPIISNPVKNSIQYYYIGIDGISVNGIAVQYNSTAFEIDSNGNGGTMIDSGNTYTYLSPLAFEPLLAQVTGQVPSSYQRVSVAGYDLCYNATNGQLSHGDPLPQISIQLANNTSWDLSTENAWEVAQLSPDQNAICFCIFKQPSQLHPSVLGNTQQRDFLVLYDRVDSLLGFTKTDCGAASL